MSVRSTSLPRWDSANGMVDLRYCLFSRQLLLVFIFKSLPCIIIVLPLLLQLLASHPAFGDLFKLLSFEPPPASVPSRVVSCEYNRLNQHFLRHGDGTLGKPEILS